MKSRTLKAICAAVSAVAVLATAMTGFAAATTTYDLANDKVIVSESVTADANSEVTYLVKSGEQIVYIDQTTANESGRAEFNYKIAGTKIVDLQTAVTYGTDGANAVTGGNDSLALKGLTNADEATYTITYGQSVIGNAGKATATIAAKDGYEITDVKVNGESVGVVSSVDVGYSDTIAVETKEREIAYEVTAFVPSVVEEENAVVGVISCTGNSGEAGIIFSGYAYPAMKIENGKAAVKLVLPAEKVNASDVTIQAYYGEDIYQAN